MKVDLYFGLVLGVVGSDVDCIGTQQTGRQSSKVPLGADVRAGAHQHFHIMLGSEFQKLGEIFLRRPEIKLALFDLMIVPHDIDADCIEPHGFDHLYAMLPVLPGDA